MKQIFVRDPQILIEWAKNYFDQNSEVLKFGINDTYELQNRLLEIIRKNPNKTCTILFVKLKRFMIYSDFGISFLSLQNALSIEEKQHPKRGINYG
jgi:hypothetical protein